MSTFNDLLADELCAPEFARQFAAESARIAAIDTVVNALDEVRATTGVSKAQLARAIGSASSVVRRLLSEQSVNPTLGTVAEVAAALGVKLALEPMSAEERERITEPMMGQRPDTAK